MNCCGRVTEDLKKPLTKCHVKDYYLILKAHGIGNGIIKWIEKWLIDRRQVVVDEEVSNWKSVLSGELQGSVFGPFYMFL